MREFVMSMKVNGDERGRRGMPADARATRRSVDPRGPTLVAMSRDNDSIGRDTLQSVAPHEFDDVTPTMPPTRVTPITPSEVGRVYVAPTPLPAASDPEIEPESVKLARDIDPRKVTTKRKMGRASFSYEPSDGVVSTPIVWRTRRVPPLAWVSGTLMFVGAVGLLAWPRVRTEAPQQVVSAAANGHKSAASNASTATTATGSRSAPDVAAKPAATTAHETAAMPSATPSAASAPSPARNSKQIGSALSTSGTRSSAVVAASPASKAKVTSVPNGSVNSNVGNTDVAAPSPKRRQMIY